MDISSALKRTGREDITLRSIVALTIQEYYLQKFQKKLEIQSVQIRGKKILIKTGNSLLNSELLYMSGDIKTVLSQKISRMHLTLAKEIDLRFVV